MAAGWLLLVGIVFAFCSENAITIGNATPRKPQLWALLVAGSSGWSNYRHQADVCHAYHILSAHGIPDKNIIVMMADDIANNEENPTPGVIINHPNGTDVYKGVLKDYTGDDVTPENFINILTGNKRAMKGIGSGKVIDSGPSDHVFVNFVDHGDSGVLGFPEGELSAKELMDALNKIHREKRYKQLVLYIEACESGSMFKNILPHNMNIFATTAANAVESSYACYWDEVRQNYLGDWYSVNWMEDSDKENIETETLQKQFKIVKKNTNTSHVMEYGDLVIGKVVVGEFQGEEEAPSKTVPAVPYDRGVPSLEVPLEILLRKQAAAGDASEKDRIQSQIDQLLQKRGYADTVVNKIVKRVSVSEEHFNRLVAARPPHLSQLECHHKLVKAFSRHCFNMGKNNYALKYAYILANMCEDRLEADDVIRTMRHVCKVITVKEGIH